jgi:hypothetical protein
MNGGRIQSLRWMIEPKKRPLMMLLALAALTLDSCKRIEIFSTGISFSVVVTAGQAWPRASVQGPRLRVKN